MPLEIFDLKSILAGSFIFILIIEMFSITFTPVQAQCQYGPFSCPPSIPLKDAISQLKKVRIAFPINEIKCEQGLQLIGKRENGLPACVTTDTLSKLIDRKWGYDPLHQVILVGLQDTYKVNQRINTFLIKIKSFGVGAGCDFPNVMINDAKGKQVYQEAFGICSPPMGSLKVSYYEYDWNSDKLSNISLNKTGSYVVVVQMYTTTTKNITITP